MFLLEYIFRGVWMTPPHKFGALRTRTMTLKRFNDILISLGIISWEYLRDAVQSLGEIRYLKSTRDRGGE